MSLAPEIMDSDDAAAFDMPFDDHDVVVASDDTRSDDTKPAPELTKPSVFIQKNVYWARDWALTCSDPKRQARNCQLVLWADASCPGQMRKRPSCCGFSVIYRQHPTDDGVTEETFQEVGPRTTNEAELRAVLEALRIAFHIRQDKNIGGDEYPHIVSIFTDSQGALNFIKRESGWEPTLTEVLNVSRKLSQLGVVLGFYYAPRNSTWEHRVADVRAKFVRHMSDRKRRFRCKLPGPVPEHELQKRINGASDAISEGIAEHQPAEECPEKEKVDIQSAARGQDNDGETSLFSLQWLKELLTWGWSR